jgi:hypothetical protein
MFACKGTLKGVLIWWKIEITSQDIALGLVN